MISKLRLVPVKADVGDYLRFGREMGAAPVQGGADFGVGLFNYLNPWSSV